MGRGCDQSNPSVWSNLMLSRDPCSDPTPSYSLNLTLQTIIEPKSTKPLSRLPSDETEIVIFENVHKAKQLSRSVTPMKQYSSTTNTT